MEKTIKIINSPFNPPLEVVDKICIKIHVPCSDDMVTLKIDTNITDYTEQEKNDGVEVRQAMVTEDTKHTKTVQLNLQDDKERQVEIDGEIYKIKLISIGKEKIEGQEFPYYELNITN